MLDHFQDALNSLSLLVSRVALDGYSEEELRAEVLDWERQDARNSGSLAEAAMKALEYQLVVVGLAGSPATGYSSETELVANELRALQRLKSALEPEVEGLQPMEVEPPQAYRERFPDHRTYRIGAVQIFASLEEGQGWHISVSHPDRYPTWEELRAAASVASGASTLWAYIPLERGVGGAASNVVHMFENPPEG